MHTLSFISSPCLLKAPPRNAVAPSAKLQKRFVSMAKKEERADLDRRAEEGETVVAGGTGGKSYEAQENMAEGRRRGGEKRKEEMGTEGYKEMGRKGGEARKEEMGTEGYKEMGRKGGEARREQMGTEGYKEMGRKGGQSTKNES